MSIENDIQGNPLKIFTYPEPVLKKVAKEIDVFDDRLKELSTNMLYTMYHAPGIGLAAPQVGESIRMFVLDVDYDRELYTTSSGDEEIKFTKLNSHIFINPEIIKKDGETKYKEGCLSLPEVYEDVDRFDRITLKYNDLSGEEKTLEADGLLSICIQHEIDHLDGIVFIDRLSSLKKNLYKKKLAKRKRQ